MPDAWLLLLGFVAILLLLFRRRRRIQQTTPIRWTIQQTNTITGSPCERLHFRPRAREKSKRKNIEIPFNAQQTDNLIYPIQMQSAPLPPLGNKYSHAISYNPPSYGRVSNIGILLTTHTHTPEPFTIGLVLLCNTMQHADTCSAFQSISMPNGCCVFAPLVCAIQSTSLVCACVRYFRAVYMLSLLCAARCCLLLLLWLFLCWLPTIHWIELYTSLYYNYTFLWFHVHFMYKHTTLSSPFGGESQGDTRIFAWPAAFCCLLKSFLCFQSFVIAFFCSPHNVRNRLHANTDLW